VKLRWVGDGDIDQQGRYGDGDDCCRDGVRTGTKSENVSGIGTSTGMNRDINVSPCSSLFQTERKLLLNK